MKKIWFDGKLIPGDEAKVSVLAHTLHYGIGVFEGIRSYANDSGEGAVFRLDDHLARLEASAQTCSLPSPFTRDEMARACLDVIDANDLVDAYLRPLLWQDDGDLAGLGANPTVHVAVSAHSWGAYLGDEGLTQGIRVTLSEYRRSSEASALSRSKICGLYATNVLAKRKSLAQGFDEALLMDDAGFVAEGSGENLFLLKGSQLVTPPASAGILPGITRDTVLHLAKTIEGVDDIREESITPDRLLDADEVFLTGTAAEITPVREVDHQQIGQGQAGPVTLSLQKAFFDLVRGPITSPSNWQTPLHRDAS